MRVAAVDVGGTFTDVVYLDESGRLRLSKVPTTPREPERGVIDGLKAVSPEAPFEVLHATTIATNSLLGQVGLELPRTALVTTRGFRDVIEIGRQNRPQLYNLFFSRPRQLVPRELRYEVSERTLADGTVERPVDEGELERVAEDMVRRGVVSAAISFLNSYRNPSNELKAKEVLSRRLRYVTASSEVAPELREYERTSTAVVNAVLRPIVSRYLEGLWGSLSGLGASSLSVMSSAGGLVDVEEASLRPVQLIESGPAAGAIAAAALSRELEVNMAIGFDMGGTTAKASSIVNGDVEVTTEYEVGGEVHYGRVVRGSGYPVKFPFVDLAEVSAGGGTIIWRDEAGALRVGPLSAGADPGPASYGMGGDRATLTDANLALGRLPTELAGGLIRLRPELALQALSRLGDPEAVASQAVELANLEMARAIRLVTVERGLDPSEFSIIAFGGAGPQHATELAEEVGSRRVIVPPEPGLFSALGLLMADLKYEARRPFPGDLEGAFAELEGDLMKRLGRVDYFIRLLDVRYQGQGWELTIRAPQDLSPGSVREAFERAHREAYGFTLDRPVEVVAARVFAVIRRTRVSLGEAREGGEARPIAYRRTYISGSWDEVPVYRREELPKGFRVEGPAIVEEYSSTIVVPRGWRGEVGPMRAFIMRR
ncbi:hydantoinase/oxoprolinase family protein [Acidilobus sp. 7A]|uniref:hydantoinase/oxoprolinase family protein n=1 Tax=Acidilobus sp. 7A TaxID=1577685 RepID=UPI000764DB8E|nr:hydantoinase/oxoprolinase family protein [Acidilobus sp. 7A]AMD30647.1 5-oxoprolinase [Acidilobus sp. 7A]